METETTTPSPSMSEVIGPQHWPLKAVLLVVWALASFGASYFARDLQFLVAGWPFGFWMAAQGAVLVFLAIVVVHAWAMNRYERLAAAAHPPEATPDV
mgnify:FL=1